MLMGESNKITDDGVPTTRERGQPPTARGQQTRRELLRAAREVFEKEGYFGAHIRKITEVAGVSLGTFYTYFDSRHDALYEVVEEVTSEFIEDAKSASREDDLSVWARIERANRAFVTSYRTNVGIMRVLEEAASHDEHCAQIRRRVRDVFNRRAESGIRRLQDLGVADRTVDGRLAAAALTSMVDNLTYIWLGLGESFTEDEVVGILTEVWGRAIGLEEEA